jgi:hypothetical protein
MHGEQTSPQSPTIWSGCSGARIRARGAAPRRTQLFDTRPLATASGRPLVLAKRQQRYEADMSGEDL